MSNMPKEPYNEEIFIAQDVQIRFANFRGVEDQFNRAGARNFNILLNEVEALELQRKGFNVRTREGREEGDPPQYTLKMNVQFNTKGRPPRIVMVTSKNKNGLDESTIGLLDIAVITKADVRFRAYEYEPGKKSAYVVSLFANIVEDELEDKYSHIPEQGMTPQPLEGGVRFESY